MQKYILAATLTGLLVGTAADARLAETPWPTYRHDARHTGRAPVMVADAIEQHWSFSIDGSSQSGVMVGPRGNLFFATNNGEVISLDRGGFLRWRFQSQGPIRSAPCLTQDEALYFGSFDGCLYALHAPTGVQNWAYCIGAPISSPAVVDELGRIYFGATDGYLRCVSTDGVLLWETELGGSVTAGAPSLDGAGHAYIGGYENSGLLKISTLDGSIIWRQSLLGAPRNTPAISDAGNIYIGSRSGKMYAFAPDGAELWCRELGAEIRTSAALAPNGNVIVGTYRGQIFALDPLSGEEQWETRVGTSVEGSPVVDANNRVYVGGAFSSFVAISENGDILYHFGGSVADGVVSIDGDGRLYAASEGEIGAFGRVRPRIHLDVRGDEFSPGEPLRIALVTTNPSHRALTVDRRVWLTGPNETAIPLRKDNSLVLAAGASDTLVVFNQPVAKHTATGTWRAGARLIIPASGWICSEHIAPYQVVTWPNHHQEDRP